eukprot:s399_g41.t1
MRSCYMPSRRLASALPGAVALLISCAWCWTAIPAAAKVRRNALKTGHSGPLLVDGPVFWDLDNLMPRSNLSLRAYCCALARRFVGPTRFRGLTRTVEVGELCHVVESPGRPSADWRASTMLSNGWGRMPMALFGPWGRLDSFGNIGDLLNHFNVSDDVWNGVIAQLGDPGNSIAILSAVPKSALVAACGTTVTPNGALTAIQATQVGLVWRLSRRVMAFRAGVNELDYVDDDPWVTSEPAGDNVRPGRHGPQGSSGLKEQVLKMGSLVDQSDESELLPPTMEDVNKWHQNYVAIMGAQPDETEEPTSSQLAALAKRTLSNRQAPYVDFAIWVPFGRRMAKLQKAKVYTPLGDGTYLFQDIPGPSSFQAWACSWRVFRCACVMLGIVSIAALECYYRHIEKLITQYPQCWGLVMVADDTARAERLEKLRRHLIIEASRGRQVPLGWDESDPWSTVFTQLVKDEGYWNDRVHHPATAWLAMGARGVPTVATEAAVLSHLPGSEDLQDHGGGETDIAKNRKRQANQDKRRAQKRRKQAQRDELLRLRGQAAKSENTKGKGGGKGKPCEAEPDDHANQGRGLAEDESKGVDIHIPRRVLTKLEQAKSFSEFRDARAFRFLHMYSGPHDVLAESLKRECERHQLKFQAISLDQKIDPGIDLSTPENRETLEEEIISCEFDYFHAGFPCNTFSRARWNPGKGPKALRSAAEIYGLSTNTESQQQQADRGTVMATSASHLMKKQCHSCKARGIPEMATLENPPGDERAGSAWELPEIKRDLEEIGGELVDFHTCAYMEAKTRWKKPGRWGGKLQGMASLSKVCRCPPWVAHAALEGKQSTEKAAEYPEKLCDAVAKLVVAVWKRVLNLEWWRFQVKTKGDQVSSLQRRWLANEEAKRLGVSAGDKRGIKRQIESSLEAGDLTTDFIPKSTGKKTKRELRQEENEVSIGGMRNPDAAVERLHLVREVGQKMRDAWEIFAQQHPQVQEVARRYGTPEAKLDLGLRDAWRNRLMEVLGGDIQREGITLRDQMEYVSPLYEPLWAAWQRASKDPDDSLPVFIREGVPLGMSEKIPSSNGIFPEANELGPVEDAAPELEYMKDIQNYVSVTDQPADAKIEVDRYREKGFVKDISWEEASKRFGCGTVSKLALIVKTKPDLSIKRRIVIDLRRSKGNDRAEVGERLILPRICDVLRSLKKMRSLEHKLQEAYEKKGSREPPSTEIYLIDFADAFCHYPVHKNELRHCLSPGLQEGQWLLWVALLFGFKSAPLLMARLSSAAARFIQSMVSPWESMAQIYVDDLLLMVAGDRAGREHLLAMNIYTLSALGMMLSLQKGERGRHVVWIGTTIELGTDEVRFGVPKKMCDDILEALTTWPSRGMIPLRELRSTTGKLSWVAGIIPRLRWAVSVFYAVLADGEADLRQDKEVERAASRDKDRREKPHLIAVKRMGSTVAWLTAMILRCREKMMLRREPLFETEVVLGVVTDASPLGLGAMLIQRQPGEDRFTVLEALEASVSYEEAEWFQVQHGASASQSVMEAYAVLRALRRWQARVRGQSILIRSDSAVALAMLRKLSSPGAAMNFLGAEISLLLEDLDIPNLRLHHLAGKFNVETDYLSRPHERGELPAALKGIRLVKLKPGSLADFSLPPPGAPDMANRAKWQGTPTHHRSVWDFLD